MEKGRKEGAVYTTVFSCGENGGNPAPVFLHADGMTDVEMQAAAAQEGVECVFVLNTDREGCDFRLRYFVPDHELSSCGHVTVAAVTEMLKEGRLSGNSAVIDTLGGLVPVSWEKTEQGTLVQMSQFLPEFRDAMPAGEFAPAGETALTGEEIAKALRIAPGKMALTEKTPAECVSTSRFKLLVPVDSRETLDSLEPDYEALWTVCEKTGTSGFYVFARDEGKEDVFYARQFPLRSGYLEDPATGVAATALGCYAVHHSLLPVREGLNRIQIFQGFAMGRPSCLIADVKVQGGEIAGVQVCGYSERTEKKGF